MSDEESTSEATEEETLEKDATEITAMTGGMGPIYVGDDPSFTYPPFAPYPPVRRGGIVYPTTTTTVSSPLPPKKRRYLSLPPNFLTKVLVAFLSQTAGAEDTIEWARHMRLLDASISHNTDGSTIMTLTLDMEDIYGDQPEED